MPVVMHIPYTFSLFVKSKKATDILMLAQINVE